MNEYWEKCDTDFIHGIGAESFNQFIERVDGCIQRLSSMKNDFITIFTHGHVIRAIRLLIDFDYATYKNSMKLYRDNMLKLPVHNSEIFEVYLNQK